MIRANSQLEIQPQWMMTSKHFCFIRLKLIQPLNSLIGCKIIFCISEMKTTIKFKKWGDLDYNDSNISLLLAGLSHNTNKACISIFCMRKIVISFQSLQNLLSPATSGDCYLHRIAICLPSYAYPFTTTTPYGFSFSGKVFHEKSTTEQKIKQQRCRIAVVQNGNSAQNGINCRTIIKWPSMISVKKRMIFKRRKTEKKTQNSHWMRLYALIS